MKFRQIVATALLALSAIASPLALEPAEAAQSTLSLFSGPQDPSQLLATINQLILNLNAVAGNSQSYIATAPLAADLVYIKAAATPANGTITIANQPDYPRKFQIRIVIGTTNTTAITAGTLTLVGTNCQGLPASEVVSLIETASTTLTSANCYSHLTSGTVAAYAASGSGTGNTLGIGQSSALGIPLPVNFSNLIEYKEDQANADETLGTVDTVNGTITPSTAPNGSDNFQFWYTFNSGI